jgi:hypothetical protein
VQVVVEADIMVATVQVTVVEQGVLGAGAMAVKLLQMVGQEQLILVVVAEVVVTTETITVVVMGGRD